MYVSVNEKIKKIKRYIVNAKAELSSIKSEFSSSYNINDSYIEKNNIDSLDAKFKQILNSIDYKILPLTSSVEDDSNSEI